MIETRNKTVALAFAALVAISALATGGVGSALAQTSGNTTTLSDSSGDGTIDVTVSDATTYNEGIPAVQIDISNLQASTSVDVTSVSWVDTDSTDGTHTLATPLTIPGDSSGTISTVSSGSTADVYTGAPAIGDLTGDVVVDYTTGGTSASVTVSVDLDADSDMTPNSVDQYPLNELTSTAYTVNTTEGNPSTVYATLAAGSGEMTYTLSKLNTSTDYYEQVDSRTVTANSTETKLTEFDISGASDGTEYMITTHGTATVQDTGITYEALSGGAGPTNDGTDPVVYGVIGVAVLGFIGYVARGE